MPSMYDKGAQETIEKAAEALKKDITPPEWAKFVKTSPANKRTPSKDDWYVTRAASILRKIYMRGPLGVNKLRVKYGSKKNRGHKPEMFVRSSGKIIRTILRQLQEKGYIKEEAKGVHKGRVVTPKGRKFLDNVAKGKQDGHGRVQRANSAGDAGPNSETSGIVKAN